MSVFISVHRSWRARSSRRWWSSCLAGGILVDHVPHVCTLPPLQEKSQCPSCCAVIVKTQYKTIIIVDYFESSLFIWAINLILEENWVILEGRGIELTTDWCLKGVSHLQLFQQNLVCNQLFLTNCFAYAFMFQIKIFDWTKNISNVLSLLYNSCINVQKFNRSWICKTVKSLAFSVMYNLCEKCLNNK